MMITGGAPSGQYINVTVDGTPLDPERVGLPGNFDVLDTAPGAADATREDFFLTDQNWVTGIARVWAGFFVPNEASYRNRFQPGKQVRFKNGSTRTITSVVVSGDYLNVYVEGAVLDPLKSAFRANLWS
ncbi:hypothetical protein [Massilia suwonensis]|uniref:Uncharacterized protein n=1 Tax=Massilia suwonensis TaxID=648895 RepID=A0ABW0MT63_9BURK